MADLNELLKTPPFMLKIAELVLSIVTVGLGSHNSFVAANSDKVTLVCGVYVGYVIICILHAASFVLGNRFNKNMTLLVTIPGAILYLTAGAFQCEIYNDYNGFISMDGTVLGAGIAAIIQAVLFLCDSVLSLKYNNIS